MKVGYSYWGFLGDKKMDKILIYYPRQMAMLFIAGV